MTRRHLRAGVAFVALLWAPLAAAKGIDWPREMSSADGKLVLYQPQIDAVEMQTQTIQARAAVAVTPKGAKEPIFGAVWLESRFEVDRDARTVTFKELKVPRQRFPTSNPEAEKKVAAVIEHDLTKADLTTSLDALIAAVHAAEAEREVAEGLRNDPPTILFETEPALLISIDGEARLVDVQGSELKRVVNTSAFLVFDPQGKDYWLNARVAWFKTDDLRKPWKTAKAPKDVQALFDQVQKPPSAEDAPKATATKSPKAPKPPKILIAFEPTELIQCQGNPVFSVFPGNELLWVTNTKSDLFQEVASQQWWVLLSGRWYQAKALTGPWVFARPDQLPASFAQIPDGSAKAHVLAHVAGTPEAEDAVLDAQVPQTAASIATRPSSR